MVFRFSNWFFSLLAVFLPVLILAVEDGFQSSQSSEFLSKAGFGLGWQWFWRIGWIRSVFEV